MLGICDKYFLKNRIVFGSDENDKRKHYINKCVRPKHRKIEFDKFFSLSEFVRNKDLENEIFYRIDKGVCNIIIYSSKIWDIGYIRLSQNNEDDFSIFILTDKRNHNYVMTGIIDKRPFIIAPKFSYTGNRDCTKYENFLDELGTDLKITEIYSTLWMFYHDFPNNNYH